MNFGWRLREFESLPSTSDLCREMAMAGEADGLAVRADQQTAGRGSRGRIWLSDPGNLALSMLLRPNTPSREAGLWALLAGVAAAEALERPGIALKWPNDILLDGAKLGGILVETSDDGAGFLQWLVIGIGINLAAAPRIVGRRVTTLGEGTAADVAGRILQRVSHWRTVQQHEGWASIREAWLVHALPAGHAMTLKQGTTVIEGHFAGLAENGGLLLNMAGRVQAFSAGEVWLVKEHTAC